MPDSLLIIGGGARSDLLVQTLADILETPLLRGSDAAIGPAIGAARLAARGMGAEPALKPQPTQRFDPAPAPQHTERLASFRAVYAALRDVRL